MPGLFKETVHCPDVNGSQMQYCQCLHDLVNSFYKVFFLIQFDDTIAAEIRKCFIK